ncbi:MAG: 50S ribosomal protein L23 [Candidatus Levybacteria bacterium]|nr:50S ribosomal protein L23 [Candidatus Levybacteria bacterium]
MRNVILSPIITERSMALVKQGKFSFAVSSHADKEAIKQAVNSTFNVDVVSVLTSIQKGKTKRVGKRRAEKKLTSAKKAVVTVKEGQKIDIFDLGV